MPEKKKEKGVLLKRGHLLALLIKFRKAVFEIDFIKADGSNRHMIASLDPDKEFIEEMKRKNSTVKKSTTKKKRKEKFNPDHITVFDREKRNFRKINVKTAKKIKIAGTEYRIV